MTKGIPARTGARVRVERLVKRFGSLTAVAGASLDVASGEFLALLGPSGCGKTTVLMSIAGFEHPDAGDILLDELSVLAMPASRRNIGMVFQRYALFPHMTVAGNIGFPLVMRRRPKAEIRARVAEVIDVVRLSGLDERLPSQLSGGQQQRVAFARAVVHRPPLLLMDEPLAALDKKLREEMQVELKELQRLLGVTVIFVTHDQQEALAMADRVAVMNAGRIEQVGSPRELYEEPASAFVANFVGESNRFRGRLLATTGPIGAVASEGGRALRGLAADTRMEAVNSPATLMVRPEMVSLSTKPEAAAELVGVITDLTYAGSTLSCSVAISDDLSIVARVPTERLGGPALALGDRVGVAWRPEDARIYPSEASG
ncbi:MAG: ABC transporter ATP-binding protein [Casimicrobiaceae bacterium]